MERGIVKYLNFFYLEANFILSEDHKIIFKRLDVCCTVGQRPEFAVAENPVYCYYYNYLCCTRSGNVAAEKGGGEVRGFTLRVLSNVCKKNMCVANQSDS